VEHLGSYNPESKEMAVSKERILHWIEIGAKPTPTVHNLLVSKGITPGPKVAIKMKKKKSEDAGQAGAAVAPKEERKEEAPIESEPAEQKEEPEEPKPDIPAEEQAA